MSVLKLSFHSRDSTGFTSHFSELSVKSKSLILSTQHLVMSSLDDGNSYQEFEKIKSLNIDEGRQYAGKQTTILRSKELENTFLVFSSNLPYVLAFSILISNNNKNVDVIWKMIGEKEQFDLSVTSRP